MCEGERMSIMVGIEYEGCVEVRVRVDDRVMTVKGMMN